MRRLVSAALVGLLSACALLPTDGGTKAVQEEDEFTLDEGERAVVRGSRVSVEFVGVPLDERCPVEANCVSAGNALVRVRVSQPGQEPATFDLRTDAPNGFAGYHGHAVMLRQLLPEHSVARPDPDYRARLVVGPLFTID